MRISGYLDYSNSKDPIFQIQISGSSVKVLALPITYRERSGKATPRKNVNNPLSQIFLPTYDLP